MKLTDQQKIEGMREEMYNVAWDDHEMAAEFYANSFSDQELLEMYNEEDE